MIKKLLMLVVSLSWLGVAPMAATTPGDATGDGRVDVLDMNEIINFMLGKATNASADVNHDGRVDVLDMNMVINILLGKEPGDVFANLAADMVLVEGGTFAMGTPEGLTPYAHAWERPVHMVTLPSFMVCRYEVTQELWQAVMGSNPSTFSGDRRPVETVTWRQAREFAQRVAEHTGKPYRLLTEAEWEYAARGGAAASAATLYAGSDDLAQVAWSADNARGATHIVGELMPNALGLYDMSGNVLEWVADAHADVYAHWPAANIVGADDACHVVRGGSWRWGANYCRVSWRGYFPPDAANGYLGLRLACDINQ